MKKSYAIKLVESLEDFRKLFNTRYDQQLHKAGGHPTRGSHGTEQEYRQHIADMQAHKQWLSHEGFMHDILNRVSPQGKVFLRKFPGYIENEDLVDEHRDFGFHTKGNIEDEKKFRYKYIDFIEDLARHPEEWEFL